MHPWKKDTFSLWFTTLGCCALCYAQSSNWTSLPFLPSSWPLAVKGPYLNSWQTGNPSGLPLPLSVPAFWPAWDDQTVWFCIVVVDNIPYQIMGGVEPLPPNAMFANQTAVSFTATRTSFTFTAGPVNVNATFLSPVTPNDLMRQSMPFVYFYLDMLSTDGATHDIRVYSEINPQWLHGNEVLLVDPDPKVSANGSLIDSTDFVGLQMQLQVPQPFSEVANHAQDAVGVYAIKSTSNVKYQIGTGTTVRALGTNSTELQNTVDVNYSAHALDNPFDAFAISLDLGSIQSTSDPILWTVGMLRDPSINLTTASGLIELRSSYYWSNFSTTADIISFVLDDFDAARSSAEAFDQMLQNVPLSHVVGYTDLLALVTRQVFGALEITVSKSSNGTWNQSDIMIFSKDMGDVGSTGASGGTNVVDVLYAGFPAILFLNPDLGKYLLRPILESQISNGVLIGQEYAPQNLGFQFPNASSSTSSHNSGIEQSGNMLIMVLAHLQQTKDLSIVQSYYTLLKSWADYLVNQTFNAGFQTTSISDGITSFNQTNLVLKGIIGISAMSFISSAMNEGSDQMGYQAIAQQFLHMWLSKALSQDHSHILLSFGDQDSSGLIYNMYADKLLGLGLIPPNISSMQSGFYESLLNSNRTPFGIPLNSGIPSLSRLDWIMFAAASTLDGGSANLSGVLQPAISVLNHYVASSTNNSPLAIIYNPENGITYSGSNSFAVGSLFAPLVIGSKCVSSQCKIQCVTRPRICCCQSQNDKGTNCATVGGVFALFLLALGIWNWRKRSRKSSQRSFNVRADSDIPDPGVFFDRLPVDPSTQQLDRRFADIMLEIRMIRSAVQNMPVTVGPRHDSEAPPSYVSMPLEELRVSRSPS